MKYFLSLLMMLIIIDFSYAQNTFPSSGNVGIGITNPLQNLTIKSDGLSSGSSSTDYNFGITDGATLPLQLLQLVNTNDQYGLLQVVQGGVGTKNLVLQSLGGNVGIGTITPDSKLAVNGIIHSKGVKVDLIGWPDYVFKPQYNLRSLSSVKAYIDLNQHLPDMPSEAEVAKDGINLGEMNKLLTQKVEELMLYLIEKDKQLNEQSQKIQQQKAVQENQDARIKALEKAIRKISQ